MSTAFTTAYIGLGSNLENPVEQVVSAINELATLPNCTNVVASGLYGSAPMGPQDQPDYVNAVASLETSLSAHQLLKELQALEQLHRRVRERHWGPRTLDLDLILFGDEVIQTDDLIVPHPGMCERNFVLIPLYEIAPELTLPDNQRLRDLVKQCPEDGLNKIA